MDGISLNTGWAVGSGGTLDGVCRSKPSASNCKFPLIFPSAIYLFAIALGTGSYIPSDEVMLVQTTGGETWELKQSQVARAHGVHVVSTKDQVLALKVQLGLGVSDIANALQVKRPTVYQWLSGSEPRQANLQRLHKLYEVAKEWSEISDEKPGAYLRIPILKGISLIDLLSEDSIDRRKISVLLHRINEKLSTDLSKQRAGSIAARLAQSGYDRPSKEDQVESIRGHGTLVSHREE